MTQFFDLMIDTETAGLPPTGALLSIGACFFDLHTHRPSARRSTARSTSRPA